MKTVMMLLVCAGVCLMHIPNRAAAQSADELYQRAVQLETVKGELELAISVYKNLVNKYPANQPVAAKALLRMGLCYEKLGKDEAKKAYERIIAEYASQPDVVAEARARLAVLMGGPKLNRAPVAQMIFSDNVQPQIRNPRAIMPSPDARWVAYFQEDICIRNLETGDVKQVAPSGPSTKYFSVLWSPDGSQLAFWQLDDNAKTGYLKIHDLGTGETTSVLKTDANRLYLLDWSRDGRYIICNTMRNTLDLVTIKEGTIRTLSDSVWQGQRASFSPDGRFVTYARGPHAQETVYTQLITGGPRHKIAETQKGQSNAYLHPLWSPDGKAIAYQQSEGIWVVPVTNGEVSGPARLAYKTDLPRWSVAWTEAGGYYMTYNGEHFNAYKVALNPTTGTLEGTGPQKIPGSPDNLSDFAWSPNAKYVMYTGWDNIVRLYATETKAMTSFDVGSGMNHTPCRSTSDREFYFESYDPPSRSAQVKVLDMVSGKTRNLLPPFRGFTTSVAANGKRVAFMRLGSGGYEIVVHDVDNAHEQVVATGTMRPFPQLSSQNDRVLFVRMGGADPEHGGRKGCSLWVVDADSSNTRRLASAWGISSALWDPSGRFAAYLAKPDSASDETDLRILDVSTGTQLGNVSIDGLGDGQHLLTDWSGDGKSVGFYVTDVFWEYWAIRNLDAGGR